MATMDVVSGETQPISQHYDVTSGRHIHSSSPLATLQPSACGSGSGAMPEPETNSTKSCNMSSSLGDEEDYIYDYDASIAQVPLDELVPVAIVYGLTLIIGAIGNSLVIASIGRFRRLHSVTNIFLVSLASADLLLVCACVPIKVSVRFLLSTR